MNNTKEGLLENKPAALQQKLEPRSRYCLYARKSSESEERQAPSIDSQVKEMYKIAERDNLLIIEVLTESHSAKSTAVRCSIKWLRTSRTESTMPSSRGHRIA